MLGIHLKINRSRVFGNAFWCFHHRINYLFFKTYYNHTYMGYILKNLVFSFKNSSRSVVFKRRVECCISSQVKPGRPNSNIKASTLYPTLFVVLKRQMEPPIVTTVLSQVTSTLTIVWFSFKVSCPFWCYFVSTIWIFVFAFISFSIAAFKS